MKNASKALLAALEGAGKGKADIHQIPARKEPKGMMAESPGEYYWPPTIYLSDKDLPGIDKFDVGQKVVLLIEAEVTSQSKDERSGEKPRHNVNLEVKAIADITSGKK